MAVYIHNEALEVDRPSKYELFGNERDISRLFTSKLDIIGFLKVYRINN